LACDRVAADGPSLSLSILELGQSCLGRSLIHRHRHRHKPRVDPDNR
jgi:hypothetical protein